MGERYVATYGDPNSFFTRRGDDQSTTPADIYERDDIAISKANNDRLHGAAAWRRALALNARGIPNLRIMRSCRNLIRTLPVLQRDKHKIEDCDTDGEDHLYDAGRYGLVMAMADQLNEPMPSLAPYWQKPARKAFSWENWRGA